MRHCECVLECPGKQASEQGLRLVLMRESPNGRISHEELKQVWEREKEVKVLLKKAEVLGTTEKGLEGRQTGGQEWEKDVAFKVHLRDGSGQERSAGLAAGLR